MPKARWTLSMSTNAEYAKLTKRMRAAGADLAPPEPEAEWIQVRHYPSTSFVRSWSHGTVFALYVRMIGITPKSVIHGFNLRSPVWAFDPYILEDPADRSSRQHMYTMLDGSRYDRSEIVNHRLGKEGALRRGDAIEGWLLAECMVSAPARFSQSNWLPLSLSIVNAFEEVQAVAFKLPVERFRKRVQPRTSRDVFEEPTATSVESGVWPIPAPFGEEDESRR
jgi:hypothetical protein